MGKNRSQQTDATETEPATDGAPPETDAPAAEVGQTAKERLFDALTPKDPKGPPPLEEKYRGEKCYQLTEKHYREGRMFEPGECVRVKDEQPGKTWRPIVYDERYEMITREKPADIDAVTGKPTVPTPVPLGELTPVPVRASDRDV